MNRGSIKQAESARESSQDIVVVTDYHAKRIEFLWFDRATGEEKTFNRETSRATIEKVLDQACAAASSRGGRVVWIMESTTGWARVKAVVEGRAEFVLANVLQMPLPPKAYRRKTDKLDNRRVLREYLNGELIGSHQPEEPLREARRV